jgi:type IV pilus assembly protein PilA
MKMAELQTKNQKQSNTLSFIVIVSIVMTVLAIYIPNYLRFAARAKQSEARQNLMAIYSAYQSYHNFYHSYPSSPDIKKAESVYNCFTITGWRPKEDDYSRRSNYYCMNTEFFSPSAMDNPCPKDIVTTATKDSFTVASCGNVDNDPTTDVWTIDDAKHLRNVMDDVWDKKR